MNEEKITLGLIEEVEFLGDKNITVFAKIDTGATKSSMDIRLASELKLGPIIESKFVRTVHGSKLRPIIEADIIIRGKKIRAKFTLADRSRLRYNVLIGVNILRDGFLIDPS